MRLAIPNPCGIMSSHRWYVDVLSFHRAVKMLAIMVKIVEANVK